MSPLPSSLGAILVSHAPVLSRDVLFDAEILPGLLLSLMFLENRGRWLQNSTVHCTLHCLGPTPTSGGLPSRTAGEEGLGVLSLIRLFSGWGRNGVGLAHSWGTNDCSVLLLLSVTKEMPLL